MRNLSALSHVSQYSPSTWDRISYERVIGLAPSCKRKAQRDVLHWRKGRIGSFMSTSPFSLFSWAVKAFNVNKFAQGQKKEWDKDWDHFSCET